MDVKEKAQELSDWYSDLAINNSGYTFLGNSSTDGPNLSSDLDNWHVNPQRQVIDMSCLMGSNILVNVKCYTDSNWLPTLLYGFTSKNVITHQGYSYPYWQIKPNVSYPWVYGECPMPKGVMVEVTFKNGTVYEDEAHVFDWKFNDRNASIIMFKVVGLDKGWSYK